MLTGCQEAFDEGLCNFATTNKTNEHLERQRKRRSTSVYCKLANANKLEKEKLLEEGFRASSSVHS